MNYQDMSDFEINMRVACSIDGVRVDENGNPERAVDCFLAVDNSSSVKWLRRGNDEHDFFNPCNRPSDAWPIITSNGICTNNAKSSRTFASSFDSLGNLNRKWFCENTLRAAMIVFLMMRDGSCHKT